MRALLDTRTVLWALADDPRLSAPAREIIESLENDVMVSAVTAWEIAVKVSLGKLKAPENLEEAILDAGLATRVVAFADCAKLRDLPLHHRDPFDRMLVAQALVDGIPIISRDESIARYQVTVIW